MMFSQKILSQFITQLCLAKGIDHVVISPGSRNAPLTIGFSNHPDFTNFSIVDERCAAFFALGMAQQLQKPVVLVCTSGSALLNYYPAIAEAYYSDIPLVVISADRPEHLIDIGDGQTIQQENVFGNHILCSANCKTGHENDASNLRQINQALNTAIEQNGPVHINVPFNEPLYEVTESSDYKVENKPAKHFVPEIEVEKMDTFQHRWNTAERKMILAGVMHPEQIPQELLDNLSKDSDLLVFTETTSNLHHEHFFPAIDQLISSLEDDELKELQPEVLLTFGGMIVSKRIKAFLRKYPPKYHYHVDSKKANDTFFKLTYHFKNEPATFLGELLVSDRVSAGNYRNRWLSIRDHRLTMHDAYLKEIPYSDFVVFSVLFKNLPHNIHLQLANSATVRYAQLFDLHKSYEVFCNRGTSGIDGSTSTAIGAARVQQKQTVFITGDLSFFYDSNALWNNYIPISFRIIVVNNSGGGIFRILSGAREIDQFEKYFETSHSLTAKHLCAMFGFEYTNATNEEELKNALGDFFGPSDAPRLLEVFTPHDVNDQVLLQYFDYIK